MSAARRALGCARSLALAAAFALVFYAFNTPLGASIGSDNAMYLTMGTALARGFSPYTEIFDHKGPVLFLIQWLPQALSGGYSTTAVFLQELLTLFLCLRLVSAIARRAGAPEPAAELLYLAFFCSLAGGGNLSEEYTALPTLLGLFLALSAFPPSGKLPDRQEEKRLFLPAMGMGACAALCFLVRANNALPLAGCTAGLALSLLAARRPAALARCAGGFLAGFAALSLPVVLWLAARGALSASVYGAFVHNFLYSGTAGNSRLQVLLHAGYGRAALLFLLLALLGAAAVSGPLRPAFALAALAGFAGAFISHKFYDHYLMIGVPFAAAGACLALRPLPEKPRRAAVVCACLAAVLWLGVQGKKTNDWRLEERADLPAFTEDARALYALVPEEDRGRFMAYRVEPRWYAVTGALPCMRFYFLQETLAEANPAVMDEIVETFETDPPRWLVLYYDRAFSPPYDPRAAEIFETRYAFRAARGHYQLRRLIE